MSVSPVHARWPAALTDLRFAPGRRPHPFAWSLPPPSMLAALALAAFYCLMFQKYRAYDVDNPWFLSFAYNLSSGASDKDIFLGMPFPRGMDGTFYFGRLAAWTLSAPLVVSGWLPRAASLVVISFVTASLVLWRYTLASWGLPEKLIAWYLVVLGLTEPVLTTAEKFRYEFFAFFLFSLALWLASQRRVFLALFVAFLAVETEPAALICPLVVFVLLCHGSTSWKRLALSTASAAALAFALYELLHPGAITALIAAAATPKTAADVPGEMLVDYFITRPRHVADLGFLLAGYGLLRRSDDNGLLHTALVRMAGVLVAVLFFSPHANVAYMIFPMPLLVLLALRGYWHSSTLRWVPGAFVALLLTQYGVLYGLNYREGFSSTDIGKVRSAIVQAEKLRQLDDSQVRIVGDYSVWFAHPRHFSADLEHAAGDLYLCFEATLQPGGLAEPNVNCDTVRRRVEVRDALRVNLLGHELHLLTPVAPPDNPIVTSQRS